MIVERLAPVPHRGPVIAAGAVPLALAAILIELRMRQWSLGPRFLVIALISTLILVMGWLAPLEGTAPRAYHSVLLIAALLPLAIALVLLAEILGAHRPPGAGAVAWAFGVEAAIATAAARRANSDVCTLIAAVAGAIAVEEFVAWAFQPRGIATFRAILLALTAAYGAGAIRLRDRRRRHAVALVNATGLTALMLAATFIVPALVASVAVGAGLGAGSGPLGWAAAQAAFGWKLYLLAVGFGLVAYAGADHEPGPGYLGTAVLLAFALLSGVPFSERGSLVGWPLFLLIVGAAGIAIGLRPRETLPPEPRSPGASAPPTIPLRPVDDER